MTHVLMSWAKKQELVVSGKVEMEGLELEDLIYILSVGWGQLLASKTHGDLNLKKSWKIGNAHHFYLSVGQ